MLRSRTSLARHWVADEASALLARLNDIQPFLAQQTMVQAAAVHPAAQSAMEATVESARRRLKGELMDMLHWANQRPRHDAQAPELQARLVRARFAFNDSLNNLDLFADALAQRSERDTGLWLGGLDAAAEDLITLGSWYDPPPLLCYLDRGPGAAIRRAHTRLPGGGANPVAIIRIPRERMTGTSVAASLAHEVGHQAAALLGLVETLRPLVAAAGERRREPQLFALWERWVSEIVADLWAVAKLGPTATTGLMGVLGLPPVFVFRVSPSDPHPPPWLRVRLSCAFGHALYPDPQWAQMLELWDALYPLDQVPEARRCLLERLDESVGALAGLLLEQRVPALEGARLGSALKLANRSPASLSARCRSTSFLDEVAELSAPSLALAALGQGRWLRALSPSVESRVVGKLFNTWAVRRALAWRSGARASAGARISVRHISISTVCYREEDKDHACKTTARAG